MLRVRVLALLAASNRHPLMTKKLTDTTARKLAEQAGILNSAILGNIIVRNYADKDEGDNWHLFDPEKEEFNFADYVYGTVTEVPYTPEQACQLLGTEIVAKCHRGHTIRREVTAVNSTGVITLLSSYGGNIDDMCKSNHVTFGALAEFWTTVPDGYPCRAAYYPDGKYVADHYKFLVNPLPPTV